MAVMAVTWKKTYRQWWEGRKLNMASTLSTLLLRDGELALIISLWRLRHLTQA
jgi:hypothetical protein